MKRLKVELAIVVDLGVHFVNATYSLEGDGALILKAYQILQSVLLAIGLKHYPKLERVSASIAANNREKMQLKQHAEDGVKDAVNYFLRKFNIEHIEVVRVFKTARLLSPASVNPLHPGKTTVEELRRFSFLDNDHEIGCLLVELPNYLTAAEDVGEVVDPLQ